MNIENIIIIFYTCLVTRAPDQTLPGSPCKTIALAGVYTTENIRASFTYKIEGR
jgi:hypothetical protein